MSQSIVKAKILLEEEDTSLLDVLKSLFRSLEHRVKTAGGREMLPELLKTESPDILVCGYVTWSWLRALPGMAGALPPVVITASYGELEQAQAALRQGAAAILPKPVCTQTAIAAVNAILGKLSRRPANDLPDAQEQSPAPKCHFGTIVGDAPCMACFYDMLQKAAFTDLTVLLRGESGTGKDLAARAIHDASPRRARPFVAINCSSLPANLLESELFGYVKGAFTGALKSKDGLFKAADGGTLFLDEIGSVSTSMQLSLLRVLQDRLIRPVGSNQSFRVDVRVVAATNENLEDRIREGLFREDLFYRLNSFPISIPPLRERKEDIVDLARYFLLQDGAHSPALELSAEAANALEAYAWPGNVRELQNVIRRCIAVHGDAGRLISAAELDLPQTAATSPEPAAPAPAGEEFMTLKAYIKMCERNYLRKALDACHGDKEAAAAMLGISLGTFYRKYEE